MFQFRIVHITTQTLLVLAVKFEYSSYSHYVDTFISESNIDVIIVLNTIGRSVSPRQQRHAYK